MSKFTITAANAETQEEFVMIYDNEDSTLVDLNGVSLVETPKPTLGADGKWQTSKFFTATSFDRNEPVGKKSPRVMKIALGLSCNYECEYCSQRFVPRADETNKDDVAPFIDGLDSWVTSPPEKIEFWGGEPLVYIKTMVPLAEALRAKYPDVQFSIITNGSILTPEINEWLEKNNFSVGLSHDGPGQHVRGPDPFADPEKKANILDLYRRLSPKKKMSFNVMMNRANTSRKAAQEFFIEVTGDPNVSIGEGGIVDAYDEGGISQSLRSEDHLKYRNSTFGEIRYGEANNFGNTMNKIADFVRSIQVKRPASSLGQRCGMDKRSTIAVDLKGNVLTCQNVSIEGVAPNGESHKIGHVSELDKAKLNTARHWSKRDDCAKCPVLQLCKGACMFLEGPLWDTTCDNAYSDNIPAFAAGIEILTGYVPIKIEGDFRDDRKDIWGLFGESKKPMQKHIPIKQI